MAPRRARGACRTRSIPPENVACASTVRIGAPRLLLRAERGRLWASRKGNRTMERETDALQCLVGRSWRSLLPEEAFYRLFLEIEAVPVGESDPVNLDVQAVVSTVLGVWARTGPLREAMRCLPLDQETIDKLPGYALALAHAQALYKIQAVPPNILAEKAKQVRTVRDLLFSDAQALVKRGSWTVGSRPPCGAPPDIAVPDLTFWPSRHFSVRIGPGWSIAPWSPWRSWPMRSN